MGPVWTKSDALVELRGSHVVFAVIDHRLALTPAH